MTPQTVMLAKSNGITLVDHTDHLREHFRKHILPMRGFVISKYASQTNGSDLLALTLEAIRWHDAGKKHPCWQIACRKDYECWKAWHDSGRKGKEPRGTNLMHAGIRHEFDSLARMLKQEPEVSLVIQAAVAAHHGKLSKYHKKRWLEDVKGEFAPLWRLFASLSDEVEYASSFGPDFVDFDHAILRRYQYAGPRSLLQMCDHRASAAEEKKPLAEFKPFIYNFPEEWERRGVQKIISELWNEPVALLRAPTGAGKTDAALIWAKHQIERGRADRLVIAMPTRFTANSLSISDPASMSQKGLYHSTAWYQRSQQARNGSYQAEELISSEQDMAQLLETPITVTTLDHLCICLTGTREEHQSIFFNLAHSCVVIDEADFYDAFTQASVVVLLRALRLLNVPVLIMSATLPESFRSIYDAPKIHEDTSDSQRIRCRLKRCETPVVQPSDIEHLLQPALSGTPAIIYANTVQRAQRYYRWFLRNGVSPDDVVLYHSRFTEPDKVAIEGKLLGMLGKAAWETGTQYGVAILTQIGELSVNISADYMLSELCPLDRLVQRVGRLARFPKPDGSKSGGDLHLLFPYKLSKEGKPFLYPAPYGSYVSGAGWVPAPALTKTEKLLQDGDYSAADFVRLVNTVYPEVPEVASHIHENQRKLLEMIGMNWLIQPGEQVTEEADQTKDWKCRDIPFQKMVYVNYEVSSFAEEANQSFPNWRKFREFQIEHGIQCHAYEHDKAVENGRIEEDQATFLVGANRGDDDKKEKGWIVRPGYYDSKMGLHFDLDDED